MTIVANVPTSQTATVEDAMMKGVCAACRKPIAGHFNADTKAWEGCAVATEGDSSQETPHPLRRSTDIIIMVPVTILHDAITAALVPQGSNGTHAAPPAERRGPEPRAARPTTVKTGNRYPTRGKPAGRYVAVPNMPPKKMTESINRVWFAMKNTKRGIVAKELAERLQMADGTMAWVLNQLQKEGSIVHVRPGEQVPAAVKAAAE